MTKLATYLLGSLATALGLALIFTLNIFLAPILGYWMIIIDLVYVLAGLVLISYLGELSIPFLRTLLRRAYYRAKFKMSPMKEENSLYLKILASLIILFKSTEAGFELIKDEAHIIHSKALILIEEKKNLKNVKHVRKASQRQLLGVHKTKERRAATLSAGALILLVIGSVIVGLLSSLIFPAVYQSRAATYTWVQNDWSGGTSTSVAIHPGDQIGWTQYAYKDDNIIIDGSGNITMQSGSQDMVDDTDADFQQGEYDGQDVSFWTINGSVTMGYPSPDGTFAVAAIDWPTTQNLSNAQIVCNNLCSNCALPKRTELSYICNHKTSYGNNFGTGQYWASEPYRSYVIFPDCVEGSLAWEFAKYAVRCVRR